MVDIFKIYKGQTEITSGPSPLIINGVGQNISIIDGEYQVVRVVDGRESERVNIPTFKTLSVAVTDLEFSPKTSTADAGTAGSRQITATVLPENANNKKVNYDISPVTEGLSISETGKITWTEAVPAGVYTTTGTTEDGKKTAQHILTLNSQS
ncbi:MAG: phage tail protein [Enterococcus faecalis]